MDFEKSAQKISRPGTIQACLTFLTDVQLFQVGRGPSPFQRWDLIELDVENLKARALKRRNERDGIPRDVEDPQAPQRGQEDEREVGQAAVHDSQFLQSGGQMG